MDWQKGWRDRAHRLMNCCGNRARAQILQEFLKWSTKAPATRVPLSEIVTSPILQLNGLWRRGLQSLEQEGRGGFERTGCRCFSVFEGILRVFQIPVKNDYFESMSWTSSRKAAISKGLSKSGAPNFLARSWVSLSPKAVVKSVGGSR